MSAVDQVRAAETAFANRWPTAIIANFAALIAEEAIFWGGKGAPHGKTAVVADWKRFFDGALGAVFVGAGRSGSAAVRHSRLYERARLRSERNRIGTFNSVWQRQPDGAWKIVFDKGCPPCNCAAK